MKPDADTLFTNTRGKIPKQVLTGKQSGLFGKQYLSGPSVYDLLDDDEQIHYLLVNRSSGVTIEPRGADEPVSVTPGSEYRAIAVITDQRIFFVIGDEPKDTLIEIPVADVTGAEHRGSLLSTTILIEADFEKYSFSVKKRGSSDPQDTVAYIQQELVPVAAETNAEESTNVIDTDQKSEAKTDVESGSMGPTDKDSETTNGERDLLDISGVTEDIVDPLNQAGYETPADLRYAPMEAIADVDGLTKQIAMRIKLDVGE